MGGRVITINGSDLTVDEIVQVARWGAPVQLDPVAEQGMDKSLQWVAKAAQGALTDEDGSPLSVYGVNTGYGSLARVRVATDELAALSWNLVRSHAAGVGPACPKDVTRAMMLLRANTLCRGASGCRPVLVHRILDMLNAGITPEVPQMGSCGSSGDLAPLSHLGLVVFRGETEDAAESGIAYVDGERMTGMEAMAKAGLERLIPGPKEGLAMTNGAQLTTAYAALALFDSSQLILIAEVAAAMSFEALQGVTRALHPEVHKLRPYPGAQACAANLRDLLSGSTWVDSVKDKIQDAYSLRCTPVVFGAVRDGIEYAARQINIEINSVTDNPIILADDVALNKAFSAGLFHGEPVGMACDHLKLAVCELGALAERRLYRLTTGALSAELPPLLATEETGFLGMMAAQATAAACVSQNRALAYPASADTIPTCEDQEDHVAMSTTAARSVSEVVGHAEIVVAIELLTAAHALRYRMALEPNRELGQGTKVAFRRIRELLGTSAFSGVPSNGIAAVCAGLRSGTILSAVEEEIGALVKCEYV